MSRYFFVLSNKIFDRPFNLPSSPYGHYRLWSVCCASCRCIISVYVFLCILWYKSYTDNQRRSPSNKLAIHEREGTKGIFYLKVKTNLRTSCQKYEKRRNDLQKSTELQIQGTTLISWGSSTVSRPCFTFLYNCQTCYSYT